MILRVFIIVFLCLLFWLICYLNTGSDKKNMLGYRSYPKAVQDLVKKDEVLCKMVPGEINLVKVFISNLILFTVIFLIVGLIIKFASGFNGFWDAFIYFLLLGGIMNLFDLVVIDLLWWRNTSRIRFSCVSDKALYQDPSVHLASFYRGAIMYLLVALLVSCIISLI